MSLITIRWIYLLPTLFIFFHFSLPSELRDRRKSGADEKDLVSLRSRVFKAEKKLSFLLSWSQRYGMGVHHLLPHLHFEIGKLSECAMLKIFFTG